MFCKFCGKKIGIGTPYCPYCGSRIDMPAPPQQPAYQAPAPQYVQPKTEPTTLATVAFVFMIISTVLSGLLLIPLAWMLPMTLIFKKKIDAGLPVGVGFKVCTLLFVSTIAGILMLCDDKTP